MSENRSGFISSMVRAIALAMAIALAWAAIGGADAGTRLKLEQLQGPSGPGLVGFDAAGNGIPVRPGPLLAIENGYLNCTVTISLTRQYGVPLTQAADGTYPLPSKLRNLPVLYRNGLRQALGLDYEVKADAVVPLGAWAADDTVLCDGEPLP